MTAPAIMQAGATPPPPEGGVGYEVIRNWDFFDTQPLTTATTVNAAFFQTIQGDPTLGNMPSQAQLPDGWIFDVEGMFFDFLVLPSFTAVAAAGAGVIADVANVLNTGRALAEFKYNDKSYGTRPVRAFPPTGAPIGFLSTNSATTGLVEDVWTTPPAALLGFLRGLRIQPKTKFALSVITSGNITLNVSPLNLCCTLRGTLWRKLT